VLGQVQSLADLHKGEMGGEIRKQPKLGGCQAHRPGAGRAGCRRHAPAQLLYLVGEGAEVWTPLKHLFGSVKTVRGRPRIAFAILVAGRSTGRDAMEPGV
jgi:hypothetical protein